MSDEAAMRPETVTAGTMSAIGPSIGPTTDVDRTSSPTAAIPTNCRRARKLDARPLDTRSSDRHAVDLDAFLTCW